jgi:hypothetical protein
MKTLTFPKSLAIVTVASLTFLGFNAVAQETPTAPAGQAAVSVPPPQLSYAVAQVLQLNQAKVGDDTIIAYVRNTNSGYSLDANQIIFLRQQGVSEAVITAMLNQPRSGIAPAAQSAPAAQPTVAVASSGSSTAMYNSTAAAQPTATVAPTVTYVQTVPTYYSYPYAYPYYYPYYYGYGWYPGVSIGFGFRGGWGGGWHGGWHR